MSSEMDALVQDMARGAGKIIAEKYASVKTFHQKSGPGDVVTEVDLAVEEYLVGRIQNECPDAGILSEECGIIGSDNGGGTWILDPIDGTRNYLVGIPLFCVSIGILKDDHPGIGAIYDPIHDELFFAHRGSGATLNGKSIQTSPDDTLTDSMICVSWMKHRKDRHRFIDYIDYLSNDTSYFRRFGSAALAMAYCACGRLHGYIQSGVKAWDICGGVAICQEAGALVTDFRGQELKMTDKEMEILVANPPIHKLLRGMIDTEDENTE